MSGGTGKAACGGRRSTPGWTGDPPAALAEPGVTAGWDWRLPQAPVVSSHGRPVGTWLGTLGTLGTQRGHRRRAVEASVSVGTQQHVGLTESGTWVPGSDGLMESAAWGLGSEGRLYL